MRLDQVPGGAHLTYCTNIHAGESWAEIAASLDHYVPAVKAALRHDAPFGLGLRLSGLAASELVQPDALARFRDQLDRLGAYVFTLNAFPYGPFHGTRVKEQVYDPDWRRPERVAFTADAAGILSALLQEGGYGSISTVPGAYRPAASEGSVRAAIAENLLQAAGHLLTLERTTGRTIALALEPEPSCMVETTAEAIEFFETALLSRPALARFAALAGVTPGTAEATLRRHLGICYDVCHGAIEFEDPAAALRALRAAGIAIPKIQLSAALRVPAMQPALIPRLQRFDAGVYLHQVVVRGRALERYADLPDAFAALHTGRARGEWRVHCHVPVFLADLGEIGTTQNALRAALGCIRADRFSPHLEVETYTWDVLPDHLKTGSKADDIARELAFVLEELTHEHQHDADPAQTRHPAHSGAGF